MAEEVVFTTRGSDSVAAAQAKLNKGHRKTRQEITLTNRETKNLGAITRKVYREIETPQEKYLRKMREAKIALKGQKNETELLARAEKKFAAERDRALDKTKKKTKDLGSQADTTFSINRLAGYAAGFVSIQKVVQVITDELRAQQELIDKRNAKQLTVSQSRNVLLRNLDPGKPDEIEATLAAARRISARTGVGEAAIDQALAKAISATGGNVDLATKLTRLSALYLPDKPGEIGDFAGTLGDLTKVSGSLDPEVQLGYLTRLGALSRIADARLQAKNIPKALIGTIPFGGDYRTSGALFSALTVAGSDDTGEITGSGLINLATRLEEATLGTGAFKATKTSPGPIKGLAGTTTLAERIAYLQENPEDATYFLRKAGGEAKVKGPIRQLLTDPTSVAAQNYQANLTKIPGTARLDEFGNRAVGIFPKYNTLEPVAERTRRLAVAAEQQQTRAASRYLSSSELENLRTVVLETGGTSTGEKLSRLIARARGGGKVGTDEAIAILEGRLDALESPTYTVGIAGGPYGSLPATRQEPREPTEAEREQAQLLREQVQLLKKSLRQQEETNSNLGKIKNQRPTLPVGSG